MDLNDAYAASSARRAGGGGLHALLIMASLHGISAQSDQLTHEFGTDDFTSTTILLAAKRLGLTAKVVRQDRARIFFTPLPAIAADKHGNYFIVAKFDGPGKTAGRILIQHPEDPPQIVSLAEFLDTWNGEFILFTSKASFSGEAAQFDFTWFVPVIIKYRKMLFEVLCISLVLQVIGLVTPMFFQVVMDKVLVNQAMKTLNVISIGLVCATFFDVVLSGIRSYAFSHTSSKIDVELGARLFRHLLNLPIAYFEARRVGDSVTRIKELENIRSFLTGNAMTLVLDVLFSFIYFGVMLWYSVALTMIVLASIPLYFVLSAVFTPILRNRLNEKFNRNSENQSFLVETVSGIQTVKSMALEPRWRDKWEQQLASYVAAGLSASNTSILANSGVTVISKLVTAGIMWMGASLVIDGKMTVGELIAFNMLSNQISSPILRLAQLWNDFQQVGISMSRLGDILNSRPELSRDVGQVFEVKGDIAFDDVAFRYRPDARNAIDAVSLTIGCGEVIGVVGRSGSGKSTLTKLVQRLYVPERGRVTIDGLDISVIDAASLRKQIGVVLQENVLFARSIRDNIAVACPSAPVEKIIEVSKLAGAHDFICELPNGYDTLVGEHGVGLSGGQRQRIAIARALISDPRILIFDEATSALDYESEKIIQNNMRSICAGRTVLIIAHRLSAVRDATRIVVMDQGRVAEIGDHQQLLRIPDGIYAGLHRLQAGHADLSQDSAPAWPAAGFLSPALEADSV